MVPVLTTDRYVPARRPYFIVWRIGGWDGVDGWVGRVGGCQTFSPAGGKEEEEGGPDDEQALFDFC